MKEKELNMNKQFWVNPYQNTLTTKVASVEGNRVLFEDTIAFHFSGGQESDKATVNGLPILNSEMEKEHPQLIYYILPDDHKLSKGDTVKIEIDWPRRYRLMRLHFAAELVLEIVTQKYKFTKVGAHIAENKSRIDFLSPNDVKPLLDSILTEYNKIVAEDRKIQTGYSDVNNQRRFWKIEGYAKVPCGGTHVRSTKEVGDVNLQSEKKGSKVLNGEKISIYRIEIKLKEDFLANPCPES